MRDKVLILNPGSTSTKIAIYCNDEIIHLESIQHSHEDLLPYAHVQDQKEYRLEKIQKKTGLDVRVFDDALTFKIAMMVADHMKYMKQ